MSLTIPRTPESRRQSAKHIDALDGVRGIAILLVLAFHLQLDQTIPTSTVALQRLREMMSTGWSGVDLFFVLSGFLITGILLDTKDAINRGTSFYARRILRIAPLYYLAVFCSMLASYGLRNHTGIRATTPSAIGWLSYLLYFQNSWMPVFEPQHSLIQHFWSLGVEEQFYLLWPSCVWFTPQKYLLKLCLSLCAIAILVRWFLLLKLADPASEIVQYNLFARMDSLLTGAICAIAVRNEKMLRRVRPLIPGVVLVAATGMYMIDFVAHEIWTRGFYTQLLGYSLLAFGYGAFVLAVQLQTGTGNLLDKALTMNWLRAFGRYSYGIYVFHPAVFQIGQLVFRRTAWHGQAFMPLMLAVTLAAVSFGVAWLSFHCFEKRFLYMKDRFRPVRNDKST